MSGHLCLKWNNHSSAFLKSFSKIQMKERYCDSTIVCQGRYFPVHRIILSTCSAYFDELFQKMQCQHPYIVFKDIEPKEMELLLNYMYRGEVNVVQEMLPSLIKAAECLRIKGLAEPDDLPASKESSGKKRGSSGTCDDSTPSKKRSEEKSTASNSTHQENTIPHYSSSSYEIESSENLRHLPSLEDNSENAEIKEIKQEQPDPLYFDEGATSYSGYAAGSGESALSFPSGSLAKNEGTSAEYSSQEETSQFFKTEEEEAVSIEEPFGGEQSASWDEFPSMDTVENTAPTEDPSDATLAMSRGSKEVCSQGIFHSGSSTSRQTKGSLPQWTIKRTLLGFHCPHCDYKSQLSCNVKTHVRHKHTKERPYSCPVCPSRFTQKIDLERHSRVHTGEKPFRCSICSRNYTRMLGLKNHLAKVHQQKIKKHST